MCRRMNRSNCGTVNFAYPKRGVYNNPLAIRRERIGPCDPDRVSFTKALHATRRSVRVGLDDAVNLVQALHRATTELLHGLLPTHEMRPQPTLPTWAAVHVLGPPSGMGIGPQA